MTLEREVKLGVWPGFVLPDLSGIAGGVRADRMPDQHLEAVYHDTPDLRLARRGITLRHRTGEGDDRWTLKLPKASVGYSLVREEIDVLGQPKAVPEEIRSYVLAWVRTAPLQPVARLHTLRWRAVLRGDDGKTIAEIVDDEVSVLESRRVALRFREVEVEVADGTDPRILDELVGRLRAAGAGTPDATPKVVRALGPRALEPAELGDVRLRSDASADDVLRAGLTRAVLRVLEHDAAIRLTDDDEAVHQARVGTRRLRSDLRTFAPLLDTAWSEPLRNELGWLADALGRVRDTDVLVERLEADVGALEAVDVEPAQLLVDHVRRQRAGARADLVAVMASGRYLALLDRLVDAAHDPAVLPGAAAAARDVLPRLAAVPWSALAKAVKRAGSNPSDEVLHGIRIHAKRARYAADVAALVVGKPAERFSLAMANLQDVLGVHQDACVRRAWLRTASAAVDASAMLAAGQLMAMARAEADDGRRTWREAWNRAGKGRLRTWLTL